jgi:hypothetical protein
MNEKCSTSYQGPHKILEKMKKFISTTTVSHPLPPVLFEDGELKV